MPLTGMRTDGKPTKTTSRWGHFRGRTAMRLVGNGGIEQLLQQSLDGCAAIFGGQPLRGRKSTELDNLSPDREVYRLLAVHRELMDGPASAC